jgi:signal transduction histidine kinase
MNDPIEVVRRVSRVGQLLTGRAYLHTLTERLASELDLAYVFVGRAVGPQRSAIETLELWANGAFAENFTYELASTPCRDVLSGNRVCIHPSGVTALYPDDRLLADMHVESYMGAPITSPRGELVGLLVALDTKPREDVSLLELVLEFFAGRAGAELDRQNAEDRMRSIQKELEARVEARTRELEAAQERLVALARRAGMADVAAGVLHNVGNLLTAAEASAQDAQRVLASPTLNVIDQLSRVLGNQDDLTGFLARDARGQRVPELLVELHGQLANEQDAVRTAVNELRQQLGLIQRTVELQQAYAGRGTEACPVDLAAICRESIQLLSTTLHRHRIRVTAGGPEPFPVHAEPMRLFQVLGNLLRNAIDALKDCSQREVRVSWGRDAVGPFASIEDSGPGVSDSIRSRLFTLGASTKSGGHGIGLHSSALFMQEMGGRLELGSPEDGAPSSSRGACFVMRFREVACAP